MAGPVTIQTDSVMARVSEATAAHLRDALAIQRAELTREWEARQADRERAEQEAAAKAAEKAAQDRRDAVRHWTALVGFTVSLVGALGAAVSWWTGKIRAEEREECAKDALDERIRTLEAQAGTAHQGGQQ